MRLVTLTAPSAEKAAETPVYLASSPDVAHVTGKYFVDRVAVPSSELSYDQEASQRLWQESAELVGLRNDTAAGLQRRAATLAGRETR
jgi:hypothetical protein